MALYVLYMQLPSARVFCAFLNSHNFPAYLDLVIQWVILKRLKFQRCFYYLGWDSSHRPRKHRKSGRAPPKKGTSHNRLYKVYFMPPSPQVWKDFRFCIVWARIINVFNMATSVNNCSVKVSKRAHFQWKKSTFSWFLQKWGGTVPQCPPCSAAHDSSPWLKISPCNPLQPIGWNCRNINNGIPTGIWHFWKQSYAYDWKNFHPGQQSSIQSSMGWK